MSSKGFEFRFDRDIPRILFGLVIIFVIAVLFFPAMWAPLNSYANLILVVVTAIYVYLTYELLRNTRYNRPSPYVSISHVVIGSIDSDFFRQFEPDVEKSEAYLNFRNSAAVAGQPPKNAVFILAENTGESLALEIELSTNFNRKDVFDEQPGLTKKMNFKDLKPKEKSLRLLAVFDQATTNDYIEITRSHVTFKDISANRSGEAAQSKDLSNRLALLRDDTAVIVFKETTRI